ncbi:MAG: hypothetical protein K0R14_1493 [Burkholderiales bacterium]|jgi:hypothetical protein|nr:hypothetical protein [Burkholderiales bacterium]
MANNKLTKSLRNSIAAEAKKVGNHVSGTTQAAKLAVVKTKAAAKPKVAKAKKSNNMAAKAKRAHAMPKTTTTNMNKAKAVPQQAKAATAHKGTAPFSLPNNPMIGLAQDKLHYMVETNYNMCETCLENLQKVNDNLHDYLSQLVEINNVSSLIKLNLTYLSTAPTRYQEMIAQNKSILSNFFKFAKVEE